MSNIIPTPATLEQITWLLIGFMLARAFGKQCDQHIQATQWFKRLSPIAKWLVKCTLNFLHHFWIGLLLMTYAQPIAAILHVSPTPIYWFGYGLFLDDLPDVPARFRKYFGYILGSKQGRQTNNA